MEPYYEQDNATIYCGDNRDVIPFLPEVDHIVTDPPYADETHEGARGGAGDTKLIDFASVTADDLRAVFGSIRVRRWCVATMDWRHIADLERNPPSGLRFVRFGIWIKPNGAPQFTGDRPSTGWEGVCIMHSSDAKLKWNGGGRHGVWTVNKENTSHPTGKPLALVGGFVQQFTDANDLILDPYMGAGSVLEACKIAGRRVIGIEQNERYCEIAAKRLAQGVLFGSEVA